ncbi:MAG TPA: MFS transporter [Solirubrobacteraceae bacterium]|nr:MFS transporter [Solirubrobacteraceae bacterium]
MTPHPGRPHPTRSLLILSLGALAFALAQTMLIPALGELTHQLDTDASGIAWVLTGYLLAAAVATPIAGRLGDMFGKRRLLVGSLLVFGFGSVVAALGDTLGQVVAGRVLQGFGGGIFPLCFGIIRDEFPREKVAGSIGMISAIFGIGGGAGLIGGGLIADNLSYHWIFWVGAISASLAALATYAWVPESPIRVPGRIDVPGALLLAVGLALPLLAISRANAWGWGSPQTLGLIAAGIAVLGVWVAVERRTHQPLAHIPTLLDPPVLMTNLVTLLVGFGMFGSFLLIPQLAEAPESTGYGFGLDATGAGLLMLPGALMMLVAGPVSGQLGTRFGSKLPLTAGAALTGLGLLAMALDHSSQLAVTAWNVVISIGIGLAFAAMANLIVEAVPPSQTGEATGVNTLVRSVGASIGSQVTAAILAASVISGSGLAQESGFTAAYLVCAGVAGLAAVLAALIPRGAHAVVRARVAKPVLAER